MATRPSVKNPLTVLRRHRNFRIFWLGQTASLIGTWMQSVGQGWMALQLTNSAFMVGLVAAAGAFPVMLLSLYGGVIADRHDKLKLVTIAQALLLVQASLLWWFVWSGHITVGWLLGLTLANGAISAFEVPARQSFIIDLVVKEDLAEAIALNAGGFNLARIIGPSIAGLVIHEAGLAWCFAINALSYLAVLISLFRIKLQRRPQVAASGSFLEGFLQGARYTRRTPEVWSLMRLVGVFAIFSAPYLALMPVIARDVLHGNAGSYGWLLTSVGIGGLAGALALATLGQRARGLLLERASYAFSILLMAFSLSRSVPLSCMLLLGIGFTMILTNAVANGLLQGLVPDALRGRVMAAYVWVVVGVGPVIGPFLAGLAAKAIGSATTVGIGAAVTLIYARYVFSRRSELRALV
ncbi:MAG: MFS transporter [Gemmatimonadota bacterium]|nr:MFS transporter [Gemmatimonadota bacterium]